MSDTRVVMRVSMHVLRSGTLRYYAAYTRDILKKATTRDAHPDQFLGAYVHWPVREYRWCLSVWSPQGTKHNPNSIVGGVRIDRFAAGPIHPQSYYTNDQARTVWRQYAILLYSNATRNGN